MSEHSFFFSRCTRVHQQPLFRSGKWWWRESVWYRRAAVFYPPPEERPARCFQSCTIITMEIWLLLRMEKNHKRFPPLFFIFICLKKIKCIGKAVLWTVKLPWCARLRWNEHPKASLRRLRPRGVDVASVLFWRRADLAEWSLFDFCNNTNSIEAFCEGNQRGAGGSIRKL